jgi:hypothetical protein
LVKTLEVPEEGDIGDAGAVCDLPDGNACIILLQHQRNQGILQQAMRAPNAWVSFRWGILSWHGIPFLLQNSGFYYLCYINARLILELPEGLATIGINVTQYNKKEKR